MPPRPAPRPTTATSIAEPAAANPMISLAPGFVTLGLIFHSILTNTWDGILPSTLPVVVGLIVLFNSSYWDDDKLNRVASVIAICISLYYLTYFISLVSGIPHDSNFPIILIIFLSIMLVFTIGYGFSNGETVPINTIINDYFKTSWGVVGAALAILTIPCGLGYGLAQLARKFGLNSFPDKDGKSKNVKCTRPATQAFKCTVYKNGKPVGDIMD